MRLALLGVLTLLCAGCGASVVHNVLGAKYDKAAFASCMHTHHATTQNLSLNAVSSRIKSLNPATAATIAPDRKSTRLNSSHIPLSRMPSSA